MRNCFPFCFFYSSVFLFSDLFGILVKQRTTWSTKNLNLCNLTQASKDDVSETTPYNHLIAKEQPYSVTNPPSIWHYVNFSFFCFISTVGFFYTIYHKLLMKNIYGCLLTSFLLKNKKTKNKHISMQLCITESRENMRDNVAWS